MGREDEKVALHKKKDATFKAKDVNLQSVSTANELLLLSSPGVLDRTIHHKLLRKRTLLVPFTLKW